MIGERKTYKFNDILCLVLIIDVCKVHIYILDLESSKLALLCFEFLLCMFLFVVIWFDWERPGNYSSEVIVRVVVRGFHYTLLSMLLKATPFCRKGLQCHSLQKMFRTFYFLLSVFLLGRSYSGELVEVHKWNHISPLLEELGFFPATVFSNLLVWFPSKSHS